MGLFNRTPKPPPVRRDQVMNLISLGMKETDAADRDIDSAAFTRAKAARDEAVSRSTKEELNLAYQALKRHGY